MIYKTYMPPELRHQESAAMDEQTARRWDEWCDNRIQRKLESAVDGIAEGTAELNSRLRDEIRRLRDEVRALRLEVDLTKGEKRHADT